VIVGGASIGALSSFATHSILPALSILRADLHSRVGTTQLIVSVALLALGTGQLIVGPFSDRYGRRPVILTALALYFFSSIGAAFAPHISWLIFARALQAFGCGGSIAVSRATIMDYFGPERAAVGIAYTATAVLLVPMFAPTLGGYLAEFMGWRWIFAICAALGLAAFVFTWWRIAETHPHGAPAASKPRSARSYVQSYRILLSSPQYLAFLALGSFLMAAMYTVITGAPYVVIDVMGLAPSAYGRMFVIPALGSFSGFFLAAKVSRRFGPLRMVGMGVGLGLVATLTMAALMLFHYWHPVAIFIPAMMLGFANALSTPSSVSGAIGTHPEIAGAASGLMGFAQLAISAAGTQLVAVLADRTPIPFALTVLALVLGALVSYPVVRKQARESAPSPDYDGSETVTL
jgi:DHA1 family bicyclomycin/chloramphenicol resistance-like MFS transporter